MGCEKWIFERHPWYGIARVAPHPNALLTLAMLIVFAAVVLCMKLDHENISD